MTDVLDNTRPASFKGVRFHVRKVTTSEGTNFAKYLYINTGRRVVKNLGQLPAEFSITGFTHGIEGNQYEQARDNLRAVLKTGTVGTLVHPFLGNFEVIADKYTFSESFTTVGVCDFTLSFSVAEKDGGNPNVPASKQSTPSGIKASALIANRALQSACSSSFNAISPVNRTSAKDLVGNVFGTLADTFGGIGDTIQQGADYTTKALKAKEQASYYVDNPVILFAEIADGVLGIDGLTTDVFTKVLACQALFDFGDDGTSTSSQNASTVVIPDTPLTVEDAERKNNSDLLNTFMQGANTVEGFSQIGNSTFTNTDEVTEYEAIVRDQFEKIKETFTTDPEQDVYNFGLTEPDFAESYEALKDVTDATLQLLAQQKEQVAFIETIRVYNMPASVLSYTLYGTSDRSEQIMDLNPTLKDNLNLNGDIKVLSV